MATKAAAGLGIAPKVAAMLESPPCLVTCFVAGRADDRRGAARARAAPARWPAALRAVPRLRRRAAHDLRLRSSWSTSYARSRARARRRACPAASTPPAATPSAIARRIAGHAEHAPVPCHNDLLTANFLARRRARADRSTGSTRAWATATSTSATSRSTTSSTTTQEERLLEAYFGEPPDARRRATLKLFRFMSDFREAMWGVVQSAHLGARLRLRRLRRRSTSSGCEATAADPRFEAWLEEARVERPTRAAGRRPLRDRRRRRGRHLDRVPPRPARLGRRRAGRAQPAHLGLDVPLRRPGRASCAARCR